MPHEPLSQNGYTDSNNNPVMYVVPNGLYSNRTKLQAEENKYIKL